MDFEKLYTVEDVAEYTGLTSRTIRNYLKNGTLSGRKVGGQWRFTMKNIANLIDSSTASGDIIASDDQFAHDFISGINTEVAGELQTLMVSDYYCPNAERAERLHEEFSTLYASSHDTDGKYLYYYHKPEQRARYIFCGAPELLGSYVERLKGVWQDLHRPQRQFSGRSANYLAGREDYPEEFFEYLYRDFCLSPDAAIADIGSGIGTMSGHFLGRGNLVYCIEPNEEMKAISDRQWGGYANYRSYLRTAEDTRLPTNSVDYIVCGNSLSSFDVTLALPEFLRILKKGGKLIVTHYYPHESPALEDMQKLWQEHKDRVAIDGDARIGREFAPGKAQSKTFYQTHRQDFSRFLSGCLSSAFAPGIGDARYDGFVNRLKDIFDRHSVDGALPCTYRLLCLIGDPSDLAY